MEKLMPLKLLIKSWGWCMDGSRLTHQTYKAPLTALRNLVPQIASCTKGSINSKFTRKNVLVAVVLTYRNKTRIYLLLQ